MRDGKLHFRRLGLRWTPWRDLVHLLLRASWPGLIGFVFLGYLAINAIFALLYLACGDCIGAEDPRSFVQAFAFSVQTISTIGYGAMSPQTPWAHALVAIESFVSLIGLALASGVVLQKFLRPEARVAFSHTAVVTGHNLQPYLMFRMANERNSRIVDANVDVYVLVEEYTLEGERMRRFHRLKLEREHSPMFLLSWLVMHPLDEDSPLHGLSPDDVHERMQVIVVTLTGVDESYMQPVHAQYYYEPHALRFGHRFVDLITTVDGLIALDHGKLHDTEPERVADDGPASS